MKSDPHIQRDIAAELQSVPQLKNCPIEVHVSHGAVSLSGLVGNYSAKLAAEQAAKKVAGVTGISPAQHISVLACFGDTDTDIAARASFMLRWDNRLANEKIKVTVINGHLTLHGEVECGIHGNTTEKIIENLVGLRSVTNLITIKPITACVQLQHKINIALERNALIDADNIAVTTNGGTISLRGTVRSFAEKEEAITVAYSIPGVITVQDHLHVVQPDYIYVE